MDHNSLARLNGHHYSGRLMPKPVVFFDGGCPMCSREIAHYRKRRGAETIDWVDISEPADMLSDYGLDRAAAMARFHVLDQYGRWRTGAWGFAELWSHLPAYRWLAWILRRMRILPLVDLAYTRFARWRVRGRCAQASCDFNDA